LNPAVLADPSQGIDAARADLFENSFFLICAPPGTNPEAIKLVSDLIGLLGAAPLFADPAEIDGLLSATYLLPKLAAVGLLRATTHQPGWIENRKVAGPEYSAAITPLTNAEDTLALYEILRMNRENAARSLGSLIDELVELQEAILTQDDPGLRSRLLDAIQEKDTWISQRQAASWEKEGRPPVLAGQRSGDLLGRLFGRRKKPNP
jgi:prephenate dehydrogenase